MGDENYVVLRAGWMHNLTISQIGATKFNHKYPPELL